MSWRQLFVGICWLVWLRFQLAACQMEVVVQEEVVIMELGSIDVNCSVINSPGPVDFSWSRPSDPDWPTVYNDTLVLKQVTIEQGGTYTCRAWLQSDETVTTTANMELLVYYAPRWDMEAGTKSAATEGSTGSVRCVIKAFPGVTFYWSRDDVNMTSSSDYIITSQGNVSTVAINSVSSADYGTWECNAYNDIGQRRFPVELTTPGVPDSPKQCVTVEVAVYNATVECSRGFDGGDPDGLSFLVKKRTSVSDTVEAESEFTWNDNVATVIVYELEPNITYTLLIHHLNSYGESEESVGLVVHTKVGPPMPGRNWLTPEMIAIIGGSCGGAVLVVAVIVVIVCCCKRKNTKSTSGTSSHQAKKKDVQSYVMEDDDRRLDTSKDDIQPRRGSLRDIRNSFRLRRPIRAASGINNPNYVPDDSQHTPSTRHVPDYTPNIENHTPTGATRPYFINLNHTPGESIDGPTYENPAYLRDAAETSFDSNIQLSPDVVMRRNTRGDPVLRAQRQSDDQPGLAGFGALVDLNPADLAHRSSVHQPVTPTIRKEVRLAVKPPGFEPEVPWEFSRERLFVRLKVGEGTFGEVWRAKAEGILGRPGQVAVAVKMLKEHYTPEERRSLIKELEIMKLLQPHPNVVQLLGCCTRTDPLCIIMEYAAHGNLRDLLRQQRSAFNLNDLSQDSPHSHKESNITLQLHDLKRFGLHVASGMEYIASRELLHRDLAARNILVDENLICKVADFGSARDIIQMRQYESKTQRRLPIRWMAPESLVQCIYTPHSDVWAFGVLLWEIITLGSSPYPGMSGPEVMEFVQKGCRMEKPRHCSNALYAVMKDCWNHFPPKRPTFSILRHRMIAVLDEPNDDLYAEAMYDNAYEIFNNLPGEKC